MKIFLATTTINIPTLLEEYAKDAVSLNSKGLHSIEIVVAGDRKTPQEIEIFLKTLQETYQVPITYLSPSMQMDLLSKVKAFKSYLDFDCIQRRNLAGFFAYLNGAEVITYIDDDNLISHLGYFQHHLNALGLEKQSDTIRSSLGFANIMSCGEGTRTGDWLFPRGYPFSVRNQEVTLEQIDFNGRVCANAGLWTEEPDIDAVSRIAGRPLINNYILNSPHRILHPGTWTPLNSQNTSFLAEFLPTYFLSSQVGRYDDIFAGYIMQRIAMELDCTVAFGEPVVRQIRNEHNLIDDLKLEILGMGVIDFFLEELRSYILTGDSVDLLMSSLIQNFESTLIEMPRGHFAQSVFKALHTGYSLWVDLLKSNS